MQRAEAVGVLLQAQLVAMFGKSRGRFTLTALQQQKLVDECVKQERPATELQSALELAEDESLAARAAAWRLDAASIVELCEGL